MSIFSDCKKKIMNSIFRYGSSEYSPNTLKKTTILIFVQHQLSQRTIVLIDNKFSTTPQFHLQYTLNTGVAALLLCNNWCEIDAPVSTYIDVRQS